MAQKPRAGAPAFTIRLEGFADPWMVKVPAPAGCCCCWCCTTAADADTAAAQYGRQHHLRQEARKLFFDHAARTKVAAARRASTHRDRTVTQGQWVYVWRCCPTTSARKPYGLQRERCVSVAPSLGYEFAVWAPGA